MIKRTTAVISPDAPTSYVEIVDSCPACVVDDSETIVISVDDIEITVPAIGGES